MIADHYMTGVALRELIRPFTSERGMSWSNPEGTIWFTLTIEGNAAGICALAPMKNGHGRCKSDVVLPLFRKGGIYGILSAARLEAAKELKMRELSAFAGTMSIGQFLKDGFKQEKPANQYDIAYLLKDMTNA